MKTISNVGNQRSPQLARFAPLMLLVTTGTLLGLTLPMAKIAQNEGLAASHFLVLSVAIAALLLGLIGWKRGHPFRTDSAHLRYYIIAALVSVAVPNQLLFWSIPHVGSGYAALFLALPPLFTYAGAVAFRLERFNIVRAAGVTLALIGTIWLAWQKLGLSSADEKIWLFLLVLVPVSLAIGNIFRTKFWPEGAMPDQLAPGMMIAAALLLSPIAIADTASAEALSGTAIGLILGQGFLLAWQYLFFFQLQAKGGPVLLSLIGSVAALVAVPISVVLLGENWPSGLLMGAELIVIGIAMVVWRRKNAEA